MPLPITGEGRKGLRGKGAAGRRHRTRAGAVLSAGRGTRRVSDAGPERAVNQARAARPKIVPARTASSVAATSSGPTTALTTGRTRPELTSDAARPTS